MRRYRRSIDLVKLHELLAKTESGLGIEEMATRFEVSRRTAERMLSALREQYPRIEAHVREGRKYWRLSQDEPETGSEVWDAVRLSSMEADGVADSARTKLFPATIALVEWVESPLAEVVRLTELRSERSERASLELGRLASLVTRVAEILRGGRASASLKDVEIAVLVLDDVLRSVAERVRLLAATKAIELIIVLDPIEEALRVSCGARALSDALVELCKNSIDAMPLGGRLVIHCDVDWAARRLRFCATDTGRDIGDSIRSWIFDQLPASHTGHAGFTRGTKRRVAEAHSGSFSMVVAGPNGTEFELEVPVVGDWLGSLPIAGVRSTG